MGVPRSLLQSLIGAVALALPTATIAAQTPAPKLVSEQILSDVEAPAPLAAVLGALELRADRIAVELNGALAPRTAWAETPVNDGDRLEIVHFVGGGRR